VDQLEHIRSALSGRYTIERELGSGGMATVYLADDVKHDRKVAVKVFHEEIASALGAGRFAREIQIAAKLSHPHILPLFDSGEAHGLLFYVMPYVAGESLRQKLRRERQLDIPEAISIVRQVAMALEYAHAQGLIHRDISPENILLHEGEAIVADFGIARAIDQAPADKLTARGIMLGKADYMSPEQATADPALDARSDIYSLGCVLYELLAGEPPFGGATMQAVIAKRFMDPVPSVRRLRATVPPNLDQAIAKALAKVPADRFATARAFAEALSAKPNERAWTPSVAVLPFLNLSRDPDSDYFADGITEDVIAHLSKVRGLKVISRSSVMPFKARTQGPREVGEALHTATILDGSVRRAGNRVRIVAELIDVRSDQNVWAETYDRDLTDIFAIQSDVAMHIAGALQTELSADERSRIRKEPTQSLLAYQLFLQGRHRFATFRDAGIQQAIAYFERALTADPAFALAYAHLAFCYAELLVEESAVVPPRIAYQRAKEAVERALELDPALGESHGVRGLLMFTYEFDWAGAEKELKMALQLSPGSADICDHYAWLCTAMGRYDEAITLTKQALELDPFVHRGDYATALLRAGQYDEAIAAARRTLEVDPAYARAHSTLGWILLKQGHSREGLAALERAVELTPGDTGFLAQLGQAYGLLGETNRAHAICRKLDRLAEERYVSMYHRAFVHVGLGEYDHAMDLLERAYDERAGALYNLKGSLLLRPLQSHPRFQVLLRKLNLT